VLGIGDANWTPPTCVVDWPWVRAVITFLAPPTRLVHALGVRIRIGEHTDNAVRVEVWNDQWSAVGVGLTYQGADRKPWFHDQPVIQGQALAYDLAPGTVAAIAVRLPASAVGRSRGTGPTVGFLAVTRTLPPGLPSTPTPPSTFPGYPKQYPQF
jgi:hypothetical protein